MSELDKFKRRTIRSVARLLHQKKPPDELWAEMKKETGTDCRVLWERMRALCIKKLNRMLAVDDRSDSLPSIARLSLTDWLLVDLVLVHEKIDVIAMEKCEGRQEPKPLVELFNLVQRFEVEGCSGEQLACAWAAATVHYNRQGRQCSPMLLQRRWHQLKKLTRSRFYHFWQAYRGNTRLLADARQTMPTHLQMAVAKRYPAVITKAFPDWQELIKLKLVILPEEFESKMRITKRPKPSSSNDPDLLVIEPIIETIELDVDSDSEGPKDDQTEDSSDPEKSNDARTDLNPTITAETVLNNDMLGVKIKSEPVEEDGLSNVQVVATTHVTEVEVNDDSPDPDTAHSSQSIDSQIPVENQTIENESEDDVIEIPSAIPTINIDIESPKKQETEILNEEIAPSINSESSNLVIAALEEAIVDDIIKLKAEEFCSNPPEIPKIPTADSVVDELIKDKVDTFLNITKEDISFGEKKPDISTIDKAQKTNATTVDLMADLNFIDDGIEFVDDGVEFVEEEDETSGMIGPAKIDHPRDKGSEENNKFDLKLLMDPVVYTTKLDQMNIFKNKPFDFVQNKVDIERTVVESKPVSQKSFNINIKHEDRSSQIDNSGFLDDGGMNDDLFTNQEESDEESDEDVTVSINNNMLKKPKSRTYNPILLCKNPDFNTKLRRLNIGFFSSTRNRELLNVCIPMTIDVSKSFESKLVNGTLYLKPTGTSHHLVQSKVIDNQISSVTPSAMHVQSLMDNSKKDIHDLVPRQPTTVIPDAVISERTKTINLPDIDKIRRINQQLLTAQVPPIRVIAGDSYRTPTQTISAININKVDETKLPESQAQPIAEVPAMIVPETMPSVVKVESEACLDSKSIPPDTETIVPPETLAPAKEKLLKIINQAKILTQEALTKIDIEAKKKVPEVSKQVTILKKVQDKPKLKESQPPIKIPERRKLTFNRVPVPWKPRFVQTDSIDDFLITDDTLNKMLHLMTSEKNVNSCNCCSIKIKKAEVKKQNKLKKKMRESNKDSVQDNSDNSNSGQDQNDNKTIPKDTNLKPVLARGRVVRYCCWARQKIWNRKRITKHTCALYQCQCCCREELTKLLQDQSQTKAVAAIELSDDEENSLKKACESIENVVQQSRELIQPSTVLQKESFTPVKAVIAVRNISSSTSTDVDANTGSSELSNDVVNAPIRPTSDRPLQPIVITKVISGKIPTTPQKKPSPQVKVTYAERQLTPTTKCVPCSCQTPAVTQGKQRNLVIDASRKCPIHPAPVAPKNEKVLYLHSKSIAKTPSESPIFLGKNKILLTTVKFPRKEETMPPECEVFQAPKIIPTLPLPIGVQLLLLPSGAVTYTTEPGIELSEDQLATLPTIIAAVQAQLNSTTDPSLNKGSDITCDDIQPVVNVPQHEMNNVVQTADLSGTISLETQEKFQDFDLPEPVKEILEKDSTEPIATSIAPIATDETQQIPDIVQPIPVNPSAVTDDKRAQIEEVISGALDNSGAEKDNPSVSNDNPTTSEASKVDQTELQTEKQNQNIQSNVENSEEMKKSEDKEATTNRKSLLSDLMEMSGISPEDTSASEQPAAGQCIMVNADQARNLPELSPVTSFAELKYACEHNGKFFKLDFETGIIVPINVCIKKNPKQKAPLLKTVIDLTDDKEDSNDITGEAEPEISQKINQVSPPKSLLKKPVQYMYRGKTVNVSDTVKPIKLFKAVHQPAPSNQKTMTVFSLTPKKSQLEKRKRMFNKIEAKIDLVDSDAPMEEEYLMDSSDDEDSQTEPMLVEALDMSALNESESSDDEPLAKKSKRMKETTAERADKDIELETNIRLAIDHLDEDMPDSEHNHSEVTDNDKNDTDVPMDSEKSPGVADNEPEKDCEPVLRFMSVSDNEGGEDDCILGV